ncbi:MAG TPA: tRNA (adenosine(37)-N6)-threonylcarbamoyltransferase complex ATPase subunit type 1 TsaE [Anseongella sp.]|nr:tRNA (adenosine(37)-N6)-threonylcarbamoyltransferase complex ATPase subunit type 1 TsaE [Anseongella sp.]
MEELELRCSGPEELPSCAGKLLDFAGGERIFLFYGEMGAGKTTFIRAICRQLGVTSPVSSPTFALINEYAGREGPVYHFDFYRLKNETEAYDIGAEEYFESGHPCLVEWPERVQGLLPPRHIRVEIEADGNLRKIKLRNFT